MIQWCGAWETWSLKLPSTVMKRWQLKPIWEREYNFDFKHIMFDKKVQMQDEVARTEFFHHLLLLSLNPALTLVISPSIKLSSIILSEISVSCYNCEWCNY